DPEAAKVLKIERGVTAFPELQDDIGTVLTDEEMISLDFARDLQSEVVRPPLVTPASGVGFGDELSRLSEESLFGNRTPADAAAAILSDLESMQPAAWRTRRAGGPDDPDESEDPDKPDHPADPDVLEESPYVVPPPHRPDRPAPRRPDHRRRGGLQSRSQ